MIKLVLDEGNTSLKAAFWEGRTLVKKLENTSLSALSNRNTMKQFGVPEAIIFSSVVSKNTDIRKYFSNIPCLIMLSNRTPIPLKIKYKTPNTLGNDRLANAAGARAMFPGFPVLVIDAGTCVKFDCVDARANYLGGSISPGLAMRFMALNHYTARLPLLKASGSAPLVGASTRESIESGVQNGIIAETSGMIEQYQKKFKQLKIILTGGDHRFFAGNLKKHIFVAPNLTLMGLNEILEHNIH